MLYESFYMTFSSSNIGALNFEMVSLESAEDCAIYEEFFAACVTILLVQKAE